MGYRDEADRPTRLQQAALKSWYEKIKPSTLGAVVGRETLLKFLREGLSAKLWKIDEVMAIGSLGFADKDLDLESDGIDPYRVANLNEWDFYDTLKEKPSPSLIQAALTQGENLGLFVDRRGFEASNTFPSNGSLDDGLTLRYDIAPLPGDVPIQMGEAWLYRRSQVVEYPDNNFSHITPRGLVILDYARRRPRDPISRRELIDTLPELRGTSISGLNQSLALLRKAFGGGEVGRRVFSVRDGSIIFNPPKPTTRP